MLLAILVVLGGLLMLVVVGTPLLLIVIQSAREAARREEAKKVLTQIGQALHNYHQQNTALETPPEMDLPDMGVDEPGRFTTTAARGRQFLVGLFDPTLDLMPEYQGANVYWLYHDNYLAAKALENSRPDIAAKINAVIASYGVTGSGKIEIVFNEADHPLPFRHPELIEVKQMGEQVVKTEVLTERELQGWEEYADLLLLASIALSETDDAAAKQRFNQAMAMWNGVGFDDRAAKQSNEYAVYKLALALIAAQRLGEQSAVLDAIKDRLIAQQTPSGGWITDYTGDGKPIGVANVETTSLAIVALDSRAPSSTEQPTHSSQQQQD